MRVCSQIGVSISVSGGKCVACPKGCAMSQSLKEYVEARKTERGDAFARCRVCASSEKGILTGQLLCNMQPSFHPIVGGCDAFVDRREEAKEIEA